MKKLSLRLLPIGATMLIISSVAEFSVKDAVFIGGVLLVIPSVIWLVWEIYKQFRDNMN